MGFPEYSRRFDDVAVLALRLGLGGILAYFGVFAIVDPASQVYWIASWAPALVKTHAFLAAFGVIQVAVALALILGVHLRLAAIAAALLLLGIVINLGIDEIAMRDLVLTTAALVLATRPAYRWTIRG